MRIGVGYDAHRLIKGRRLIIGGVEMPAHEVNGKGLLGHSDADVLCHAITDSIIGALGLGDIGKHFPDTDDKWRDASSIGLLSKIVEFIGKNGFEISWIDTIIIAEKPRLEPFIDKMKQNISKAGIPLNLINIKAKTNEGMSFTGRGEGIAAHAVCLLRPASGGLKEV